MQSPTNPSIKVPAQSIEQFINIYGNQLKNTDKTPLDEILLNKLNITIDPYILGALKTAQEFAEDELLKSLEKFNLTENQTISAKEIFLLKKSHSYPILFNDLKLFGIGELIEDDNKLRSVKILTGIFDNFMAAHNIIKLIGNRDQNINTILSSEYIKQRSIQTGN